MINVIWANTLSGRILLLVFEYCIRYALYPHVGSFQEANVSRYALSFNNPMYVTSMSSSAPKQLSFFQVDPAAAIVDAGIVLFESRK